MRYHGKPVWLGQISRDIGSRLTIHSPTFTTHKIDLLAAAQGLTVAESGVGVHAALSIVNDAVRLRRGTSRPEFGAQMAHLMKGVLGACVATVEP